jgi:hypothetical protein
VPLIHYRLICYSLRNEQAVQQLVDWLYRNEQAVQQLVDWLYRNEPTALKLIGRITTELRLMQR